jgi:hypothetical protein
VCSVRSGQVREPNLVGGWVGVQMMGKGSLNNRVSEVRIAGGVRATVSQSVRDL